MVSVTLHNDQHLYLQLTIRTIQKGEKAILGPILEARMAIQVIS
jgi:hypothetical protein